MRTRLETHPPTSNTYYAINEFFAHLNTEYARAGIHVVQKDNKPVTCFDEFQSWKDVQGDLQAVFIKPCVNFYLSAVYELSIGYNLQLALIHAATFSPECVNYFLEAMQNMIKSCVCYINTAIELITQSLSFISRTGISLGTNTAHLVNTLFADPRAKMNIRHEDPRTDASATELDCIRV